jgi:transposase
VAQTLRAALVVRSEEGMHDMVKRHEVQVLRKAGHKVKDVAARARISASTVKRVVKEAPVESFDDAAERKRRRIGRPSKVEAFRSAVKELFDETDSEGRPLLTKENVRRLKKRDSKGGKSAMYGLVACLRGIEVPRPLVRFDGLPGEFSQHDFGHVDVKFQDGTKSASTSSPRG